LSFQELSDDTDIITPMERLVLKFVSGLLNEPVGGKPVDANATPTVLESMNQSMAMSALLTAIKNSPSNWNLLCGHVQHFNKKQPTAQQPSEKSAQPRPPKLHRPEEEPEVTPS